VNPLASYRVDVTRPARRALTRLVPSIRERILRALIGLEANPRPPGAIKMQGEDPTWRIRVGDYRVLYEIHDRELLVLVIRVAHRREAYRR
jgi:mRNA interferase RelE/StbE